MQEVLSPAIAAGIQANSDSEYLFACLRQVHADKPHRSPGEVLGELLELLAEWVDEQPALLNIVVTKGERLYAAGTRSTTTARRSASPPTTSCLPAAS